MRLTQALDNANVSLVYVRDRSGSIRYRIDFQLQDTIRSVYDFLPESLHKKRGRDGS